MAANRCTRLIVCNNGNTYTLTGPCWYVNSMQTAWVCAGLAPGREPFRLVKDPNTKVEYECFDATKVNTSGMVPNGPSIPESMFKAMNPNLENIKLSVKIKGLNLR